MVGIIPVRARSTRITPDAEGTSSWHHTWCRLGTLGSDQLGGIHTVVEEGKHINQFGATLVGDGRPENSESAVTGNISSRSHFKAQTQACR